MENNHDDGRKSDMCTPTLESGPQFHVNERVLCTDSQQLVEGPATTKELPPLYEAIIRKSGLKYVDPTSRKIFPERNNRGGRRRLNHHHHQHQDPVSDGTKEWCHLIHFQGWNSRWDQWMTETGVFHDTPENRERVGASSGKSARVPTKAKKRARSKEDDEAYDQDDEDGAKDGSIFHQNLQRIRKACALPFTLQTLLVDDRDKIMKRIYPPPSFVCSEDSGEKRSKGIKLLHVLPSTLNIIDVLSQYVRSKKQEDLEEFARQQKRYREEEEEKQQHSMQQSSASNKDCNDDSSHEVTQSASEHSNTDRNQSNYSSATLTKAIFKQKKQGRKQFALSVIALVDISLPLFLLYKEEREQFTKYIGVANGCRTPAPGDKVDEETNGKEQVAMRKRPCEVYGAEHLLRFFVKLPYILSRYNPENDVATNSGVNDEDDDTYILASEKQSQDFAAYILELIVFLQKNLDCFKGKHSPVE